MRQITTDGLAGLIAAQESPCVSLYQPTHRRHPDNQQDPIRYRNLLAKVEDLLGKEHETRQVRALVDKFMPLARDERFWNYRTDGLAIFASPERFEIYELQRPVPELVIVAESFHTKPLIRILQSADRYQILCLSRHDAQLYEGNRDALDPVELIDVPGTIEDLFGAKQSPQTEAIRSYGTETRAGGMTVHHGHRPKTDVVEADMLRYFRTVDRGILEHHSRPSGLPLMLAALPENHQSFRAISHNPFLMDDGILSNPAALSIEELREQAWQTLEPLYLARLEELKEKFGTAQARQSGSGDLADVAKAAIASQVDTLLIEAERVIHGTLDRTTGSIHPATDSRGDDMLDDLAELVLGNGGEVIVVPRERMPTDSGLAATYRF